jgi:hypothetical protein
LRQPGCPTHARAPAPFGADTADAGGGRDLPVRDPRNIIIAVLAVAVAVLGYLYYDSQQHRISVNLPGFKLDAK